MVSIGPFRAELSRAMRSLAAIMACLALSGCTDPSRLAAPRSLAPRSIADRETERVVMGEPVAVAPLTPEPGDIWTDLRPDRPATGLADRPRRAPARGTGTVIPPPTRPPAEPAKPAATPRHEAAGGPFAVQLAAADTEVAARLLWRQLKSTSPALFDGRAPTITLAAVNGRSLWRLRAGGFPSHAEADAFCVRIQAEHRPCWVVAVRS